MSEADKNAEVMKLVQEGKLEVLNVPVFNPMEFRILTSSNNITIKIGSQQHSQVPLSSGEIVDLAMPKVDALISLSPQSAKDLMLLLIQQIESFEGQFGVINTAFTLQHAPKG